MAKQGKKRKRKILNFYAEKFKLLGAKLDIRHLEEIDCHIFQCLMETMLDEPEKVHYSHIESMVKHLKKCSQCKVDDRALLSKAASLREIFQQRRKEGKIW